MSSKVASPDADHVRDGPAQRGDPARSSRPSVLFLHSSDELYGADRILLRVLDALSDMIDPIVVLPHDSEPGPLSSELDRRGIRVVRRRVPVLRRKYLSVVGLVRFGASTLRGIWELRRLGRQSGCLAIHSNTSAVVVGPFIARLLGVKHVWHIHEIVERPRVLGRLIAVGTRMSPPPVVAISEAVARHLRADGGRVEHVDPQPGAIRRGSRASPRRRPGRADGGPGEWTEGP